ncbi:MAG: hypothetical protein Q8Q18_03555 [bacterium]|nr:hypothetical protein [bacterium]
MSIKIKNEAHEVYGFFKDKEGAEYIATPVNIQILLDLCREYNVKSILELGGGIGAIIYALARFTNAKIDVYEDLPVCQEKLIDNMRGLERAYTLFKDYSEYPTGKSYDLMIIDGPIDGPGDMSNIDIIYEFIHSLAGVDIVFVEGHRHRQRHAAMRAIYPRKLYRTKRIFGQKYEGAFAKGGFFIICGRKSNRLARMINHVANSIILVTGFVIIKTWQWHVKRYVRRFFYLVKRAGKHILIATGVIPNKKDRAQ